MPCLVEVEKSAAVSCRSFVAALSTGRAVAAKKSEVRRNEQGRQDNIGSMFERRRQSPNGNVGARSSLMETHTYPHFPSEVSKVHLGLYCNVSNAAELKKRLVTAATLAGEDGEREREAVNYAFIDATLVSILFFLYLPWLTMQQITSRLHVQTAIYQAILAYVQGSLRTKSIHSEVLWALSPGHNVSKNCANCFTDYIHVSFQISEAISRFGVSDTARTLLVIRVSPPSHSAHYFETRIGLVLKGDLQPLSSLEQFTNWSLVRKVRSSFPEYMVSIHRRLQYYKLNADPLVHARVDQLVVSAIAMKSVSA